MRNKLTGFIVCGLILTTFLLNIVSGQESDQVRRELLAKGATNYLSKDEESIKTIKPLLISLIDKKLAKS